MRTFVESYARGDEPALEALKFYIAVACEGCTIREGIIPRFTVRAWRGKKRKAVIFASPTEREELRAAARHRWVDVVSFGKRTLRYLDDSEALLVLQQGKAVEIRINEVVSKWKSLHDLKVVINLLLNKWVPTLFTCSPSRKLELCTPYQIISLVTFLGHKEEDVEALWSLGSNWLISVAERKLGMKRFLRSDK